MLHFGCAESAGKEVATHHGPAPHRFQRVIAEIEQAYDDVGRQRLGEGSTDIAAAVLRECCHPLAREGAQLRFKFRNARCLQGWQHQFSMDGMFRLICIGNDIAGRTRRRQVKYIGSFVFSAHQHALELGRELFMAPHRFFHRGVAANQERPRIADLAHRSYCAHAGIQRIRILNRGRGKKLFGVDA